MDKTPSAALATPFPVARALLFLSLAAASLAGCRPRPPEADFGSPRASLLTVAGELRRFGAQDFYRRPFPVDLSGVNAFAAALVRLENFEALHPGSQRGVAEFLRGEALLCLRDYRAAADSYGRAVRFGGGELAPRARERLGLAKRLGDASAWPLSGEESIEGAVRALDRRRTNVRRLAETLDGRPAKTLALVEAEQADIDWARTLTQTKALRPEGVERAVSAWREVIAAHPESRLRVRHKLALAHLFEELAAEYLETNPPSALRFDAEDFLRFADAARAFYFEASSADGFPEKPVARARLEAMNVLVEEALRHRP